MTETPDPPWLRHVGGVLGDPNQFGLRIEIVSLVNGSRLTLPGPGVTAIVGANNSGKSTLLRQMNSELHGPGTVAQEAVRLLAGVELVRHGSGADFAAWIARHAAYREQHGPMNPDVFLRNGHALPVIGMTAQWERGDPRGLPAPAPFFVHYADAANRLGQVGSVGQRGDVFEPPTHPLHFLQDDAGLRKIISDLSQRIFRRPLTLDHLSGSMRLRLGIPDVPAPGVDESQADYRAALAKLPLLEQQGDGMKSLLGLLLPLVAATYPIILVDEPEAFLHPPQAFQLGLALGRLAGDSGVQLVLATHDRNLLAGLLTADAPLSVVRLSRDGDTTTAAQLPAEQLAELWTDPVLRYSNVLDGLFHQLVVLCEADQDCRFYAAALDAADQVQALPIPPADVLFLPANGKAGMSRLATALRSVGVRVVASPDLDVLTESASMARLVEVLGGDWPAMQADYGQAVAPIRAPRAPTTAAGVRAAVDTVLGDALAENPAAPYTRELANRVRDALRSTDSPWQEVKRYGSQAFRGDAAQALLRLLDRLAECGVVPVRVGELERFAPQLAVGKGKEWLPAALAAGAHRHASVQEHVRRLLEAGGFANGAGSTS